MWWRSSSEVQAPLALLSSVVIVVVDDSNTYEPWSVDHLDWPMSWLRLIYFFGSRTETQHPPGGPPTAKMVTQLGGIQIETSVATAESRGKEVSGWRGSLGLGFTQVVLWIYTCRLNEGDGFNSCPPSNMCILTRLVLPHKSLFNLCPKFTHLVVVF